MDVFTFTEHLATCLRPHAVVWRIGFDHFKCILGAFPPGWLYGQSLSGYNPDNHDAWSDQVWKRSKSYSALTQEKRWWWKYHWAVISSAWLTMRSELQGMEHADCLKQQTLWQASEQLNMRTHWGFFLTTTAVRIHVSSKPEDTHQYSRRISHTRVWPWLRQISTRASDRKQVLLHMEILHTWHLLYLNGL